MNAISIKLNPFIASLKNRVLASVCAVTVNVTLFWSLNCLLTLMSPVATSSGVIA